MTIEQDVEALKSAYALQARAEFVKIRLKNATVSRLVDNDEDVPTEIQLRLSHRALTSPAPDRTFRVLVEFVLSGNPDSNEEQVVFRIACTFQIDYLLETGYTPTEDAIESFTGGNAVFNAWPFAREFVQNMGIRMGLNLPPLPLLRVKAKASTTPVEPEKTAAGAQQLSGQN